VGAFLPPLRDYCSMMADMPDGTVFL